MRRTGGRLDLTARLDRAVTTGAFAVPSDREGLPTRRKLALLEHLPGTTLR
jgi:2-dehydro-3-deoxygluconokinase